ncbi:unnamed protein product [Camellia sinensis]
MWSMHRPSSPTVSSIAASTPPPRCFKGNCDVAMTPGSSKATITVLLRDWNGVLVDGAIRKLEVASPLQGEACAIRLARHMAKELKLSQVEIAGDNKTAILLCVSKNAPP